MVSWHSGCPTCTTRAPVVDRYQVPRTRAGRRCACGTCPSIELIDPSGAAPDLRTSRVVLEASTTGAVLLLLVDDEHLSYLELAPLDVETTSPEFPDLEALRFGEQATGELPSGHPPVRRGPG